MGGLHYRSVLHHGCAMIIVLVVLALAATTVEAGQTGKEIRMPGELDKGIAYLYDLVSSATGNSAFDPSKIAPVIDYVKEPQKPENLYYMGEIDGSPSAYYNFDIPVDFSRFLQYSYNPNIPDSLFCPSSVRFSAWRQVNGTKAPFPKLWENLPDYEDPVIVNGIEYLENTPDLSSGAYFAYDLLRTVILLRHNGHNVLISVSKQKGPSQVGKKGLIIGEDSSWNYLYTTIEGLTKPGFGWVRSRIFDSFAILVYYEHEGGVRCGVFKWLRAGWAGINFVKPSHIHLGLKRFARTYQKIYGSPLPEPAEIEKFFSGMKRLSPDQINRIAQVRYELQKQDHGDRLASEHKQIIECLDTDTCRDDAWNNVLKSGLTIEYMKYILGMTDAQRLRRLLGYELSKLVSSDTAKTW
jgi:hypothetical protein